MKYIYYLIILFILFSISLAAYLYFNNSSDNKDSREFVLRVNGRTFTMQDLKERPHDLTALQFAKTIIDKELLLQEAMRLKIHEESDFKKSIKNFYEQSLISALMNRKSQEFNIESNEEEIEQLIKRMNSKAEITVFQYEDYESAKEGKNPSSERKSKIEFADLSDSLKYHVSKLKPGQMTSPLSDYSGYKVIKLSKIEANEIPDPANNFFRSMAIKIINAEKKRFEMEIWQQELKIKSDIEIKGLE